MNKPITHQRVLCALLGVLAMLVAGAVPALHAQRFQYAYGGAGFSEAGLHGVKQLANGGYVAVGESFTPNGGASSDAYVAVTAPTGVQVWSTTYAIGNNSRATDVLELQNGDLIVCGYATIGLPCHAAASKDIFVLHLTAAGAVVAVNSYGGPTSQEEAWKIIRATIGDGTNTFTGDYVIAGSTTNPYPLAPRDGYLLRINAGLGLVWDMQYGSGCGDDYFYGLDEATAAAGGAGDIVAAGGSTGPPAVGTDVFVVRVNGNNGTIGLGLQGASWTNLPPVSNNEEARSVIILRGGPNVGHIVATGFTNSAPSASEEVFMLELTGNPCGQIANLYFGENGGLPDRGYDLVEDANPVIATQGDVVVTGFTNIAGGFGLEDVFLQRVTTGPGMALLGNAMDCGGIGNDEGWSVGNAQRLTALMTAGYIINGMTQSANLIGADPGQLYLIKADVAPSTCAPQVAVAFPNGIGGNGTVCGIPQTGSIGRQCTPGVGTVSWVWANFLCFTFPQARDGGGGDNDGASGVETPATITFTEGKVTPFPNPLTSGDVLNLRFELKSAATAHVAISDVAGRVMHRMDVAAAKGSTLEPVNTVGWAAGSYLMRVTLGGVSSTARVVVVDK